MTAKDSKLREAQIEAAMWKAAAQHHNSDLNEEALLESVRFNRKGEIVGFVPIADTNNDGGDGNNEDKNDGAAESKGKGADKDKSAGKNKDAKKSDNDPPTVSFADALRNVSSGKESSGKSKVKDPMKMSDKDFMKYYEEQMDASAQVSSV